MDRLNSAPNLDFADSAFKSCSMDGKNLIISLEAWDGRTIKLMFFHAVQFTYGIGDVIDGIYEFKNQSEFLREALANCYERIPEKHPFKHFELLDHDDYPVFRVIAEDMHAIKED